MKTCERPPLRHKKGIQVVQPSHPHVKHSQNVKDSISGFTQSMSRSRGISISRQTGITMDKIYDAKHFLPPKSPQQTIRKSQASEMKTLNSVRSLKLISVFADSNAESTNQTESMKKVKDELPAVQFQLRAQKNANSHETGCASPILKLKITEQQSQRGIQKQQSPFRPNLLKF